jgi:hypothetical protein
MFINDLSTMLSSISEFFNTNSVAVGWLESSNPFPKGTTTAIFREKLYRLCRNPVRLTRGFYICPFCHWNEVRGNGEIHVIGCEGVVYVAPLLIWHYIAEHDYLPPNQFIQAVMNIEVHECALWQLSPIIVQLAGEPTKHNRDVFCRAFVKSRVGVRVPNSFGTFPSGNFVVTSQGRIPIPRTISPDKKPLLVVLADVAKLASLEAATTFAEFEAQLVIKIALENNAGIIVQAGEPAARGAFAIISANDVANLPDL